MYIEFTSQNVNKEASFKNERDYEENYWSRTLNNILVLKKYREDKW